MANLLTNGDFSSGLTDWAQSPSGCAVVTSGEAVLTGDPGGTVQLYQHGFGVTNALSYKITFTARGAVGGEVLRAQLVRHSSSSTTIGLDQNYTLTSSNATYTTTFSCTLTEADARLRFRMSNTANVVYIDNVVLELTASITADFTGTPLTGLAALSVDFTNASTGSPTGYSWEYSKDGGAWTEFSTSSGNPTHNFTDTGTYSIRLTVTKTTETDVLTRSDYIVVSGAIVAGFTGTPLSGAITLNVTFSDASTSTNGITSRTWYYNRNGTGWTQFSTSTNPVYGFTLGGSYDIRLVVEGPDGTSNLDRLAYVTATGGVVAGFTGTPLSGNAPLTVAFTDASGGTIVTRTWEYSRNGGLWTEFSSATNPSFQFNSAGTYDIRLTVTGTSTSDTLLRSAYVVVTGTDTIAATIYDETGSSVGTLLSTFAFQSETDYFVTVSYDQATGLAILYVDGAEVANENIGSYSLYTSGQIQVGQVGGLFYSNILLDELFFLNRAINPDEVRAVYESNAPVFAETSTWHWRAGRNRLWADTEGLWMVNASGTKVIGAYAGAENDANAFKTWGGVNLYESDVLIGDASRGGYMKWDDSAATMEVAGQIVILAGSTGYSNLTGIPASLADIDSAADTKLDGIEANATVGATWGTNINSIPTRFGDAPSSAGLYLTATHLGYYNGSAWKAWIASSGQFYFGGSSGAHLEWSGTKLRGIGTDGTTEQWYADSTDGKLYAGAGAIALDAAGFHVANSGVSDGITLYRVDTFSDTNKSGRLWALSDLSPSRIYFSAGRSTSDGDGSNSAGILTLTAFDGSGTEAVIIELDGSSGTPQIGLSAGSIALNGPVTLSNDLDLNGNDILDIASINTTGTGTFAPVSPWATAALLSMPSGTGVTALQIDYNTAQRQQAYVASNDNRYYLLNFDNGTGGGSRIVIGRNSNASTPAAGYLQMEDRGGTSYFVYPDDSGILRIHTAVPAHGSDTAGVIVGSQSSTAKTKNIARKIDSFGDALQAILSVPLYEFQYKEHFPGQSFLGIVTDYSKEIALKDGSPIFGMDIDKDNPGGKSLNEVSVAGHLIAAVKEQQRMINKLNQEVAALASKS